MMAGVSIIILARNEANRIGGFLAHLAEQSVFDGARTVEVLLVANGCSDGTAETAQRHGSLFSAKPSARLTVCDLKQGGKSRSWNRAVHELADSAAGHFVFVDCDIEFCGTAVIDDMLSWLDSNAEFEAVSGYPLKDIVRKSDRGLVGTLSVMASRHTRYRGAICGQLYVVRADIARSIWLPDETPCEDGFLNAMLQTDGLRTAHERHTVHENEEPTHYFEAIGARDFFKHETRMLVGTMVNVWVFAYLRSRPIAGSKACEIARLNREEPDWVQGVIDDNVGTRRWVIPRWQMMRRFSGIGDVAWSKRPLRLIIATAATLLTIPPAAMANARLRRRGAAAHW